jgi:hypothetical protein
MSVKYERFLQEQINKMEIEIAQLKGLVKSLLDAVHENSCYIQYLDNLVFENKQKGE